MVDTKTIIYPSHPLCRAHFHLKRTQQLLLCYVEHGGEARDLKLEVPGTHPTVRICISLIFSLIKVGFAWVFLQTI